MSFDAASVMRRAAGWQVEYLAVVDSTMHVAATRAPRTAIVAGEQTAGLGRHGHSWHSEAGAGLYVSLVLPAGPATAPVITLALGLAAREAVMETAGLACDIRWPNDLLLDGRKVAGILVQTAERKMIAGIGINVNHTAFPAPLAGEATSLRLRAGREFSREDLLAALLRAVDGYAPLPAEQILQLFTHASSYASGRRVTVEGITGVTEGLDAEGFLRVRADDGSLRVILAGGVRAAGPSSA